METPLAKLWQTGYATGMTSVTVDLPEALTAEIEEAVSAGWFSSESEAIRAAVHEFIQRGKLGLIERQQLDDIEWAVGSAEKLA